MKLSSVVRGHPRRGARRVVRRRVGTARVYHSR